MSTFVKNLLHGIKDPVKVATQSKINRLQRLADTMGSYARASRETFEKTGRESILAKARREA